MPNSSRQWVWPHQKPLEAGPALEHPFGGSKPISPMAVTSLRLLRIALASVLIVAISAPAYSDQASAAFKSGARAESQSQYDAAYEAYNEARQLKPKDPKYM